VRALNQYVMGGHKVHADDTPVPVLAPGRGKTKTARLWTYVRDDRAAGIDQPAAVWFGYSPDRKGEHAAGHLRHFNGIVQADGYAGFNQLYETGRMREAACWAHYPERSFIRRGTSFRRRTSGISGVRTPHKVDQVHKDCRNASRSPFGFHDFTFAGSMPALFQNACMASRFICRLIVM
jgi:hypothetical protein